MIEHLVLFKFKESITDSDLRQIISHLNNLKNSIDQINDLSVGKNFSDRSQGYQIGLRVQLNSHTDLEAYRNHKDHLKVVNEIIKPNVLATIVADYEY